MPVRCPFSLNNASLSIDPLVWLYDVDRLVVPAHTSLWEKLTILLPKMLIWQPSGVAVFMDERYELGVLYRSIVTPYL